MPDVYLSANTTLGLLESNIRERAKAESAQLSGVNNLTMVDICHQAILDSVTKLLESLHDYYRETVVVTEASNVIDISTLDIADISPNNLRLFDATYGEISIEDNETFDDLKNPAYYSTAELASALFARVVTKTISTFKKLVIETYRGASVPLDSPTPQEIRFTYTRNPRKQTDPDGKVDFPDGHMSIVEDRGLELLLPRLREEVDVNAGLSQSMQGTVTAQQQLTQQALRKEAKEE